MDERIILGIVVTLIVLGAIAYAAWRRFSRNGNGNGNGFGQPAIQPMAQQGPMPPLGMLDTNRPPATRLDVNEAIRRGCEIAEVATADYTSRTVTRPSLHRQPVEPSRPLDWVVGGRGMTFDQAFGRKPAEQKKQQ